MAFNSNSGHVHMRALTGKIMDILTTKQMTDADREAIRQGVPGVDLMEAAGRAVAKAIQDRWDIRPVMVLAGPGNNGGDGFVVARLLKAAKWPVTVYLLGDKAALTGDAAINAKRWRAKVEPLDAAVEPLVGDETGSYSDVLVVDALFGAGLSKPLDGAAKTLAEILGLARSEGRGVPVVAIDMPSGLNGDTGRALKGVSFQADLTVTFCRPKPGHLLMPGRELCGELVVADIGIADAVVNGLAVATTLNGVPLWGDAFPTLDAQGNKYARGHLVVLGGWVMTGAARLAAFAARRAGAGLVSIAVADEAFPFYAASSEPGTLIYPYNNLKEFNKLLSDKRRSTVVMGPGAGVMKSTREKVLAVLKADKNVVLDADALNVFEGNAKALFKAVHASNGEGVLTPHGGEFARLFPDLAKKQDQVGKLETTRAAAKLAGCVVLYKGADTVVAAADGRAAITVNAPPTLATAGSGDVLAGFIGALLAQGMSAFEAANAAAWLHGECADAFGPGLVAEDLIDELPGVLDALFDLLNEG